MREGDSIVPFRRGPRRVVTTLNQLISVANALLNLEVKRGASDAFYLSPRNAVLQLKRGSDQPGAGTGWRWAADTEYSDTTQYADSEIVIVSLDNPAVKSTANPEGAVPGTWVAAAVPPIGSVPVWPLPEPAYWWPVSFYPRNVSVCIDGVVKLMTIHGTEPTTP